MTSRIKGAFVLSSQQTFLDGLPCKANSIPRVGQVWSWQGEALRLDGPNSALLLANPIGDVELHARAQRSVRKSLDLTPHDEPMLEYVDDAKTCFVISDGVEEYTMVPVVTRASSHALYWCQDGLPKERKVYTVIRTTGEADFFRQDNDYGGDVICFTSGTAIRTPDGAIPVEQLCIGDKVQTKDNGAQDILWIGHRKMSGARLYAMPQLRPVRIKVNALDSDIPDADLLVSPDHRILYEGQAAQLLFNQSEVLITAKDLLNDRSVLVDYSVREVTYVHLLLADHQILWANGVQTESYHPANTTLQTIEENQREGLLDLFPDVAHDPLSYGPYARRNLDKSEAAILMHDFN